MGTHFDYFKNSVLFQMLITIEQVGIGAANNHIPLSTVWG